MLQQNSDSQSDIDVKVVDDKNARLALSCITSLFLLSTIFIVVGGILLSKLGKDVTEINKSAVLLHLLIYGILCCFCVFGIYAVASKNTKYLSRFCGTIFGHVLVGIGSGSFCLVVLFFNVPKEDVLADLKTCLAAVSPNTTYESILREFCARTPLSKGLCCSLFLVMWLLELYTLYVGNRYANQLHEEVLRNEIYDSPGARSDRDSRYC